MRHCIFARDYREYCLNPIMYEHHEVRDCNPIVIQEYFNQSIIKYDKRAKNYRNLTYYMQNHTNLKGPFTYDVTKILTIFDTHPSLRHASSRCVEHH